jgi:hypothetical protein
MVHVRIDAAASAAQTLSRLVAAGLRVTAVSEMDPTLIEGYLPLGATRAAAAVPGVLRVLAVQRPRNLAGSVQSQAVAVQKADLAQARGVDGTGTKVGVLSDSYASATAHPNAADDVASGDLPSGVVVLPGQDLPPGTRAARCCSSCTTWRPAPHSGLRPHSPARSSSRTTSSACVAVSTRT